MKLKITIGDKYSPAMEIANQDEADQYFEECVKHNLACCRKECRPSNRAEAEQIERENLGYFAGYYDSKTRERVERLFKCAHPIFGNVKPTPRESLAAGMVAAKSGMKAAKSLFK